MNEWMNEWMNCYTKLESIQPALGKLPTRCKTFKKSDGVVECMPMKQSNVSQHNFGIYAEVAVDWMLM